MNCFSQVIGFCSYALEQLGLYEPEISAQEAGERLRSERKLWAQHQTNRSEFWNDFQSDHETPVPLSSVVERAVRHLETKNVYGGIAVDLGCGISTTTFHLLERGWKVYAVDSSDSVLKALAQKVSSIGKSYIQNGQLVLVHQTIEEFKYPENIHLVTAIDSIPYSDPVKINKIFLETKNALLSQGIFVCTLFPYNNMFSDAMLREEFGAWMTTKNVVEALMRSVDFKEWSVSEGRSPSGLAKQFHVFAER